MKRTGSSIRLVLWTAAIGLAACTGYLNDDILGPGDGEGTGGDDTTEDETGGSTVNNTSSKGGSGGKAGSGSSGGGKAPTSQGGDDDPSTETGDGGDEGDGGDDTGGAGGSSGTGGKKTGGGPGAGGNGPGTRGGATGAGGTKNAGGSGTPRGGATGAGGAPNRGGAPGVGGITGAGGTTTPVTVPPLQGGQNGWMTRYWDCCKPSCGWSANTGGKAPIASCNQSNQKIGNNDATSACSGGGEAFMCWGYSPWSVSSSLSYGYVAFNVDCGKCYQIQFTGQSHNGGAPDQGSASLAGKQMIVQVINKGGIAGDQMDLLLPGGGVGDFDACTRQWGSSDLGERYGGLFLACQKSNNFDYNASKSCLKQKCQSLFSSRPDLMAGCDWFLNWYGAPDNPAMQFKEVSCPSEITSKSGLR